MDTDVLLYLLHSRSHVSFVSLRFMLGIVKTTVNSCLLPFIHCYQNFDTGLGIISLVRQEWWRAVKTVDLMVPANLFVTLVIMMADNRVIRRWGSRGSPRVCLYIVVCIRPGNLKTLQVHLVSRKFLFTLFSWDT